MGDGDVVGVGELVAVADGVVEGVGEADGEELGEVVGDGVLEGVLEGEWDGVAGADELVGPWAGPTRSGVLTCKYQAPTLQRTATHSGCSPAAEPASRCNPTLRGTGQ